MSFRRIARFILCSLLLCATTLPLLALPVNGRNPKVQLDDFFTFVLVPISIPPVGGGFVPVPVKFKPASLETVPVPNGTMPIWQDPTQLLPAH